MECPFCAETVKDEAIVCKHCNSDLSASRPVIFAVHSLGVELDRLQRELDGIRNEIAFLKAPIRFVAFHAACYVLIPAGVLITLHVLITVVLNAPLVFLRLASILVPLLAGMVAYTFGKIGIRGASSLAAGCAVLSIFGMLTAIAYVDGGPILPQGWREWRETAEYFMSIAFAFVTGNILANFLLRILPSTIVASDRPNVVALRAARLLGQHVASDTLRRRARRIQDLARKAAAVASLVGTASASIYTGLKGIMGP
jgi:hypothetical protein